MKLRDAMAPGERVYVLRRDVPGLELRQGEYIVVHPGAQMPIARSASAVAALDDTEPGPNREAPAPTRHLMLVR